MKQGQRVIFKLGSISGRGTIVGKALTEQPLIGATYIIQPDEPIQNEVYDYSHFVMAELYLTLIPSVD